VMSGYAGSQRPRQAILGQLPRIYRADGSPIRVLLVDDEPALSLDVNLRHTRPSSSGTRAQLEPLCASDFQLSSSELLSKSRFGKR